MAIIRAIDIGIEIETSGGTMGGVAEMGKIGRVTDGGSMGRTKE